MRSGALQDCPERDEGLHCSSLGMPSDDCCYRLWDDDLWRRTAKISSNREDPALAEMAKGRRTMGKLLKAIAAVSAAMTVGVAQGALMVRVGGLIYDDAQNITWLADANYAKTSAYDSDGIMTWADAMAWANQLTFAGFDDWRLPRITDLGAIGCDYSTTGGTDCGYNVDVTSSEIAHLFHSSLNGLSYYDTAGVGPQPGFGLPDSGPFTNIQTGSQDFYWSSMEAVNHPSAAWYFGFTYGDQSPTATPSQFPSYAWAVRDGDVSLVPEPNSYLLALTALGVVALAGKLRIRSTSKA